MYRPYRRTSFRLLPVWLTILIIYLLFCYFDSNPVRHFSPAHAKRAEDSRGLIIASTSADNTTWFWEHLPDWEKFVYVVDKEDAALTTPRNKGRESMVYLTYIIDNYYHLPKYNLFLHPQRYQWHNDDPRYDNLRIIRNVQLPYLAEQGYVNLRCVWWLGCPVEIRPFTDTHRADVHAGEYYLNAFAQLFPGEPVPQEIGTSCCAQFGVTREQIHKRPRAEYERFREWLLHTELTDEFSGRIMEYSWHLIFGRNAIHCPTAEECYCKVFGQCDLQCPDAGNCNRYPMPLYSTLPPDWPLVGWDGQPQEQLPL